MTADKAGKTAMLEIYIYDMKKLGDKREYEYRFSQASDNRRKQAMRGSNIQNIASAAVLDDAFSAHGFRERDAELIYGQYGKPYVKDKSIFFNLSHSGEYAVCAVSDREVGIDIQEMGALKMKVARRYFTENECKYILSQPDSDKAADMFYRLWSLKESFVKAVGLGINLPFKSFEIIPEKKVMVLHTFNEKKYKFTERDIDNYKLAVCVEC